MPVSLDREKVEIYHSTLIIMVGWLSISTQKGMIEYA
jgi:hypothetical protein